MKNLIKFKFILLGGLFFTFCTTQNEESTQDESESVSFERVNANTNPNADRVLALYAYGQAMIQSKDCTDPGSWFYQGSMHSVPPKDSIPGGDILCPSYDNTVTLRGWNSCPHMYPTEKQLNFLTWHRLYIYYYERNIRHLLAYGTDGFPGLGIEVANQFSLPYWDYSNQGFMPAAFRIQSLTEGDIELNENPLYELGRSPTLMAGQSITYYAKDSIAINVSTTGGMEVKNLCVQTMKQSLDYQKFLSLPDVSEFSRGMEDRLHNVMHDYIGGAVNDIDQNSEIYNRIYQERKKAFGLMGYIPSAGFDPIFFLHHSNVDRMFATWETMYGPITIEEMNQYAGNWETIKDIYQFWDAPSASWITYGSMQEMLDAAHSIDYFYEELPIGETKQLLSRAETTKKTLYNDVKTSPIKLERVANSNKLDLAGLMLAKNNGDVKYKLEVTVRFAKNMLEQLLVFSIPEDMDWNACDLNSAYVHGISGVFGSTHDMSMHAGGMKNVAKGQEYEHTILVDITEAVQNLPEDKNYLEIFVVPLNSENGADFYLTEMKMYESR